MPFFFQPLLGSAPISVHVRILASFHSDDGFDGIVGEGKKGFGYVVGMNTHKTFGDTGTWTLNIKVPPGQPSLLSQYADPEDVWVKVQAQINGRPFDLMIGLVDSIVEDTTRNSDGSRSITYGVTGSDFQKCFEKFELFVNLAVVSGAAIPQFMSYSDEANALALPIASPDKVVAALVHGWLGNNGAAEKQWMLPSSLRGGPTGTRYLYDWLNLGNISPDLRGSLYNDSALMSPLPLLGRTLWDVLQDYSHSLLNELWLDLGDDPDSPRADTMRPSLFLRERTFPTIQSRSRWDSLPTVEIGPGDVRKRRIVSGDGGASRFNWWACTPVGISADSFDVQAFLTGDGRPNGLPIYNVDSMRKHGVRKYLQQTKYLPLPEGSEATGDFSPFATRWTRIVHDWYSVNPFHFSGTISLTRMRPDARVGMRVRERRADGSLWVYYLEGVEHSYSYPQSSSTELIVTRGQLEEDDFLQRVYAYYTGMDLTTLSDTEVRATTSEATPQVDAAVDWNNGEMADPYSVDWENGDVTVRLSDADEAALAPLSRIDIRSQLVTPPEPVEETDVLLSAPGHVTTIEAVEISSPLVRRVTTIEAVEISSPRVPARRGRR